MRWESDEGREKERGGEKESRNTRGGGERSRGEGRTKSIVYEIKHAEEMHYSFQK